MEQLEQHYNLKKNSGNLINFIQEGVVKYKLENLLDEGREKTAAGKLKQLKDVRLLLFSLKGGIKFNSLSFGTCIKA